MATDEGISSLEQRISSAVADCQAWRSTGMVEKYLEAYDLVEALQLQLRMQLRPPAPARRTQAPVLPQPVAAG